MDATPEFDQALPADMVVLDAIRDRRRALARRQAELRRPPIWLVGIAGAVSGVALTAAVVYLAHITPPLFH
jgi:hypothetical protein